MWLELPHPALSVRKGNDAAQCYDLVIDDPRSKALSVNQTILSRTPILNYNFHTGRNEMILELTLVPSLL